MNFPVDPARTALDEPAIWRADSAAVVLVVQGELARCPEIAAIMSAGPVLICREGQEGRHLIIERCKMRHRLFLAATPQSPFSGYILPANDLMSARLEALAAFHGCAAAQNNSRGPAALFPTPFQCHRLNLMLRILDATSASPGNLMTTRTLGKELFHVDAAAYSAVEWKSSPKRRQIQRYASYAKMMAAEGYRELLRLVVPRS